MSDRGHTNILLADTQNGQEVIQSTNNQPIWPQTTLASRNAKEWILCEWTRHGVEYKPHINVIKPNYFG